MKTEVKVSVDGLEVGMFVSRLDRPWIKTPFALEGMQIQCNDDIDSIRKYCNFVYVNVELGNSPSPQYWILDKEPEYQEFGQPQNASTDSALKREKDRAEYANLRKHTYKTETSFDKEKDAAKTASDKIGSGYHQLVTDLQRGRQLDLDAVQAGISDMVDSVTRNPSAMMWIVHLKKLDEYTYSRALGTSVWCATFGRHLGLEKTAIETLATGGLLLDLGKSQLPNELLKKKGTLNEEEKKCMLSHVSFSIKLLASNKHKGKKLSVDAMQMIASHHERADGSGYPQGLCDERIPIYGKIAGIVDSYDAMTSDRPYIISPPKTPHEAIEELYQLRGAKFQSELVEQFIQTVGLYPTGSLVELSTGQVGTVIAINGLRRLRPTVILILDEDKRPYSQFKHLDLSQIDDDIKVSRALDAGAYGIDMRELFL